MRKNLINGTYEVLDPEYGSMGGPMYHFIFSSIKC